MKKKQTTVVSPTSLNKIRCGFATPHREILSHIWRERERERGGGLGFGSAAQENIIYYYYFKMS